LGIPVFVGRVSAERLSGSFIDWAAAAASVYKEVAEWAVLVAVLVVSGENTFPFCNGLKN
jgi:hypothetical protein